MTKMNLVKRQGSNKTKLHLGEEQFRQVQKFYLAQIVQKVHPDLPGFMFNLPPLCKNTLGFLVGFDTKSRVYVS